MRQNCTDELTSYDLPFECYFNACVNHEEQTHDEIEFIWLFQGTVFINCEGKTYTLTPDHVFFINIGQKHSMHSDGHVISMAFRLKKTYIKNMNLAFERIPFKNRIYTIYELAHKYHQVPLIMSQLIILMQSTDSIANTRYRLIGYYNMYLFDLYSVRLKDKYLDKKKRNFDPYLIRFYTINSYINKNYSKKITLDTLANQVNISTHRLSHFIKEVLGISFQEYVQNVRLEKALYELKFSNRSIRDIVLRCGFSDQKYLNALLKEKFHITALKYRKIMKDDTHFGIKGFIYPQIYLQLKQKLHQLNTQAQLDDTFGLERNLLETLKEQPK